MDVVGQSDRKNMLNVGLTGGIASGKSTVGRMFREKGALLVDFDALVRVLQQPHTQVWQEITAAFGRSILNDDETINRTALASIVFEDPGKLRTLNAIVHPAVFAEWNRMLAALKTEAVHRIIVSDVPLLIEAGKQDSVDLVILVYLPPEEQLRRLILRDGYPLDEARRRLTSQMPIDEKVAYAHVVIDNSGSLERTGEIVGQVWEDLVKEEGRRGRSGPPSVEGR